MTPRTARLVTVAAVIVTVVALGTTWYVLLTRDDEPATPPATTTTLPEGVPSGWPAAAVPVFQPSTVFSTERTDSAEGTFYGLTLQVADNQAVKDAYAFYQRVLGPPAFSVQVDSPNETAFGFYANLVATDAERTVNVIANTDSKTVTIGISPKAGS